jgi:hypothetical protein
MEYQEPDIDFTDLTINEAAGEFKEVKKIMSRETHVDKWAIRSEATILSPSGMGLMVLQFHEDGSIYIVEYYPSMDDLFYNPDIRAISVWAQEHGWKIPQPHFDLVKLNKEFWKHFYDTLLIDSDYLDKMYGKRPQLEGFGGDDA